jgi:hypothetical protein
LLFEVLVIVLGIAQAVPAVNDIYVPTGIEGYPYCSEKAFRRIYSAGVG